jgi:hypothetical protein
MPPALEPPPPPRRPRAPPDALHLLRAEWPSADGGTTLVVESSHQQLEALCREAGLDFASAVSPCLPGAGFVEFPRETASSAA